MGCESQIQVVEPEKTDSDHIQMTVQEINPADVSETPQPSIEEAASELPADDFEIDQIDQTDSDHIQETTSEFVELEQVTLLQPLTGGPEKSDSEVIKYFTPQSSID